MATVSADDMIQFGKHIEVSLLVEMNTFNKRVVAGDGRPVFGL